MDLGNFSISLKVKSLKVSLEFYEALGFEVIGGEIHDNWVMIQNGNAVIGLFQGMFDQNILTFNPPNLREVQKELRGKGYDFDLDEDASEKADGPAHAVFADPDGNHILLDQY